MVLNSLTWAIYAIEVVGNLKGAAEIGIFLSIITLIVLGFAYAITDADHGPESSSKVASCFKYPIITILLAIPIVVFVPTKQTAILMASSEFGETVLRSDQMAKVTDEVRGVLKPSVDLLKKYIESETKKLDQDSKK